MVFILQAGFGSPDIRINPSLSSCAARRAARCSQYARCSAVARDLEAFQPHSSRLRQNTILYSFVETIFSFQPIWRAAVSQARKKIAERGLAAGIDLDADVSAVRNLASSWENELQAASKLNLHYPAYYLRPFHAYDDGNLSWESAFQVEATARMVHATVMDPNNKDLDPNGDAKMRRSYTQKLQQLMAEIGSRPVKRILDVGCATGLSSRELKRGFPGAEVTGIDLSPYFLAVGKAMQRGKPEEEQIHLQQAAAEDSGLPSNSLDLVSMCLLLHELPAKATKTIVQEAFRMLQPGGTLAIMEMDRESQTFQRIFGNPFAYIPLKATEPWLVEYLTLDLPMLLEETGFAKLKLAASSPRHFTLAALKP